MPGLISIGIGALIGLLFIVFGLVLIKLDESMIATEKAAESAGEALRQYNASLKRLARGMRRCGPPSAETRRRVSGGR